MQKVALILTRPAEANEDFAKNIPVEVAQRLKFVASPLMRIEPLCTRVSMKSDEAAIFTSSNGVRFAPPGSGRTAYCVGKRTTDLACAAGWQSIYKGQDASQLLLNLKRDAPEQSLVHFCGVHVRGRIVEKLNAIKLKARRMELYDQVLLPLSREAVTLLEYQKPVIVPLFSPRSAEHFAAASIENRQLRIAALSPAVAHSTRNIKVLRQIPHPSLLRRQ